MSGRKIPSKYENPLDNLIIELAVLLNPYFKKMGLTANGLTAISGIFGLLTVYFIYKSNYLMAAGMFAISYIFDCFDGNFARTYNQVTEFGDWFDHTKDALVIILMIIVLYFKKDITNKLKIQSLIVSSIFAFLMCIHLSCQEQHYHSKNIVSENDKSKSLQVHDIFNGMCINKNIKYTRYVACGTCNLITVLILVMFHFKKK